MQQLTHINGAPVVDNTNTQTAGPRGLALLQDIWLLEKLAHFDREVIPERRMHAKGSGAFGHFTVTHDITRFTKAKLFGAIGKTTEAFVRFSTVAGERGAADAERDIRGFAVKFYTEEGNWDLVGNNTPVFFLRDPLRFPDLNHAVKRDPRTNLRSAQNNWDFWTLLPEALHQVTYVMGDRGLPDGYRFMHGFGSHTFSFINAANERTWVKFHLKSQQGIRNLSDTEAEAVVAKDRESAQRDLFDAIERGDFPRWMLAVQVMSEAQADACAFNPFDLTKVWPHKDFPLIDIGVLELNRNPENYFADVEQAAFSPANVVPGIGFSPDKMLQGRLFSYGDAQRYRLGVNAHQIPVNAPKCPFHAYHRDGAMRVDGNQGRTVSYQPNSLGEWSDQPGLMEPPLPLRGEATHWDHRAEDDHYTQPGALFCLMKPDEQQRLFNNTARSLGGASESVQQRHVAHCTRADPAYGRGVATALQRLGRKNTLKGLLTMINTIVTKDGTQLYYKDWGPKDAQPIVFSHGWPLNADSWEAQMLFLASRGFRCVAHDRRGHGRSSQPWGGHEMNTYADDLATVMEQLDLKKAVMVGFSTGGGEVARYIGRHGSKRVAGTALISAVPPLMLKTAANPGGLPIDVFDGIRAGELANRAQLYKDIASGPFFGFNRPGAKVSQGLIDSFWAAGMQAGHKATYDCIKAFSETDFTEDLTKFDVPTLVVHGDDDQIVPIDASGRAAAKLVKGSKLIVYPGAPHGLADTHKDKLNADLLAFVKGIGA